jgi:putative tryptophan/tyrosine transport system substrate-binding protein
MPKVEIAGARMRRREFTALLVGGTAIWPLRVYAQQPRKIPRIGVLLPGGPAVSSPRTRAFLDGLKGLGYVEGTTIAIEWKWGEDRVDTFPERAAELVRGNVDAIVTGGTPAAKALKAATQTIPIVMAVVGDPVAAGLVDNFARPGGNVTGFRIVAPELGTKRLELLKEIVPNMSSIAVLSNPKNPQQKIEMKEMQTASQAMGLHLHPAEVSTEGELEDAFVAMNKAGVQALILLTDSIFFSQRKRTVNLASKYKLPAMYFFQVFVEDGGLMSYGPSDTDLFRRAAGYVDRILKGAKPGELPVEQPTKFDLYINLGTAKALGLNIPFHLQQRADALIE